MLEARSAHTGTGQRSGVRMMTGQGAELSAGRHERQVDAPVDAFHPCRGRVEHNAGRAGDRRLVYAKRLVWRQSSAG